MALRKTWFGSRWKATEVCLLARPRTYLSVDIDSKLLELERLFKKDQEEEQKQLGEQQKQERNKKRKRSASEAKGKIKAAANVTMTNTHKKQCPKIIEDRDYVPEVTKRSPKKAKKTSMLDSPSSNNGIFCFLLLFTKLYRNSSSEKEET